MDGDHRHHSRWNEYIVSSRLFRSIVFWSMLVCHAWNQTWLLASLPGTWYGRLCLRSNILPSRYLGTQGSHVCWRGRELVNVSTVDPKLNNCLSQNWNSRILLYLFCSYFCHFSVFYQTCYYQHSWHIIQLLSSITQIHTDYTAQDIMIGGHSIAFLSAFICLRISVALTRFEASLSSKTSFGQHKQTDMP